MNNSMKKISEKWQFSAAVSIILGLILLLLPGISTRIVGYLLGALAIGLGADRAVKYFQQKHIYPEFFRGDLMLGLLMATLGILIIVNVEMVISLVPIAFGVALVSNGIVGLQRTWMARQGAYEQWWLLLIFALLTFGMGVVLIINPFASIKLAISIVGGCLIYEGISDLLTMLLAGKKVDGWKELNK
ncbi:MAG: hypothetical protein E7324_07980 [Clostridiales bacterium]|nr:hypothetical protein [Clostridiales bacterium]